MDFQQHASASPQARRTRERHLQRLISPLFIVALAFVLAAALGGGVVHADNRPPGGNFTNPVVRAVDVAEPSIVRLATLYTATIAINGVCGHDISLPSGGGSYVAGGTGSGAFISSNGDILTADHVVDIPKASLDQEMLGDPQSQAAQDAADAVNHACNPSPPLTATDIANGVLQANGFAPHISYSSPQRLVWRATSFTGPTTSSKSQSFVDVLLNSDHHDATVVASSSFDQNDLAIVHVALTDTPSIQLDDSSSVAVQDQLIIIGFPGNGDVSADATDLFTPSVNIINVSAIKTFDNGSKLIQVGGNVEHGDSGGPALDAAGHIVGVVSFGGVDTQGSTAFLRSSNDARALISNASVSVRPGTFETLWETAFSDYAATASGHWHKAAREMDDMASRYPDFKGIQPYKDYADRAAQTETTSPSTMTLTLLLVAVVAVVVMVLLGTGGAVLLARGRRRRAQLVAVPAGAPGAYYGNPYAYGYPPSPYGGYAPPSSYGSYGQPTGYGGYAPPSTYGSYGPPSFYMPQPQQPGSYAEQPVGYAPQPGASFYSAQSDTTPASGLQSGAGYRAPGVEQRSYPPVASAASAPSLTDALPPVVQAPSFPSYQETSAAPSPWSQGSPWSLPGAGAQAAPARQATCSNGHPMNPNEIYCALCGAPRTPTFPPTPSGT
jgi:S1-C subfamily serine protease